MSENQTTILIVDDEQNHADGIAEALNKYCAQTIVAHNPQHALDTINKKPLDIVITDLKFGDSLEGLEILRQTKEKSPDSQVILMTAYASIESCKQALREGAYDYLTKPVDIKQLRTFVQQIGQPVTSKPVEKPIPATVKRKGFTFDGVVGESSKINGIFDVLRRVSPTDIPVLIEGESGTGKELIARAIHQNSDRRDKAFRPVNCAGVTESLLESELFGHAKGAFTGATSDRKGLFQVADKGTLFLDEIGDMPLNMQAKLLRVIEDGVVVPVGSNKPIVVDVRLISATNHSLPKLIEQGKFRQDLYFRIKGVSISVPPLRKRPEDIGALIDYFLQQATAETGSQVTGITDSAMAILTNYEWPGNIRQLRNCIKTMVVMCDGDKIDVKDIPPEIHQIRRLTAGEENTTGLAGMSLDQLEKQAIKETLAKTNNNREKAAKILGIGERTLYRKIKEYGL